MRSEMGEVFSESAIVADALGTLLLVAAISVAFGIWWLSGMLADAITTLWA